jgi:D-serine deaminase-like pyridoxal phosphate-dependent protein
MKKTDFVVMFPGGEVHVRAMSKTHSIILAQARQIERGLNETVLRVQVNQARSCFDMPVWQDC